MNEARSNRLIRRARRHPVVAWTILGAAFLGALIVLASAVINVGEWVEHTLDWRDQEYEKLSSLHAGYTTQKFDEELGEPAFVRWGRDKAFQERTYRGRDYWVQTVSDRDDTVTVLAVTACDTSFRPIFDLVGVPGQIDTPDAEVQLNESTIADSSPTPTVLKYRLSGATANSRFLELMAGGNPANYKAFAVGLIDACPNWEETNAEPLDILFSESQFEYVGRLSDAPGWVDAFRQEAIVNTYAETAPQFDFDQLRGFQIGPDRILTRTVPE